MSPTIGRRAGTRLTLAALAAFAPAIAAPQAAHAQSAGDFSEAAASPVHYTLATVHPETSCEALATGAGADVTVTEARLVAPPRGSNGVSFCRVRGVIAPQVQFEVDLPSGWNRRFYMFGNGGYAGEDLAAPERQALSDAAMHAGFVTAQTNTGHEAVRQPLGTFAANLDQLVDYAFRAVHRTVATAKRLAAAYYGRPVAFSYWDSCSTGGREGLMSVQRFPDDFDGVIAGAPVRDFTGTMVNYVWNAQALAESGLTLAKMATVGRAALDHCDAKDGLKDGLITDPRRCDFQAARDVKQCAASSDDADCLTPRQAEAVQKIQDGITLPDGSKYFFGWPPGSEIGGVALSGGTVASGWDQWFIVPPGQTSRQTAYMMTFMQNMAFGKATPDFDFHKFDFAKDPERMGAITRLLVPAETDLTPFRAHGGKLMMYHGWADPALTPLMSVDYYERAEARNGAETADFFRLFMIPGMAHCRGGIATDRFDAISAMVNWVEAGVAPDAIRAARFEDGKVDRTRPLCPYPQEAIYKGQGNPDEAENFTCGVQH